jgi:hypothetical protein
VIRSCVIDPSRTPRDVLWGMTVMSTDMPAVLATEAAEAGAETQSAPSEWVATALTVLFTTAAVLFVSFLAVVTGLV